MTGFDAAMLVAGAAAAGFANGLAGFGTSLFSLGFWLLAFPPQQAVAMAVATATVTGLQGIWALRATVAAQRHRLMRFLVPGLIGIPLGAATLAWIEPQWLRILIGATMLLYALFFLSRANLPKVDRATPWWDRVIGLAGGFLGGLAGLSGVPVVMWLALRPWPRHETRAVLQSFNVVILFLTVVLLATRGAYSMAVLNALVIALLVASVAAQLGIFVFKRITDTQFRSILIGMMLLSGVALLLREAL